MDGQELERNKDQVTHNLSVLCLFCRKPISLRENQLYCNICGCPVINRCSNHSCNTYLNDDDCFCYVCGEESVFIKKDLMPNEYNYKTGKYPKNEHIRINHVNEYEDY